MNELFAPYETITHAAIAAAERDDHDELTTLIAARDATIAALTSAPDHWPILEARLEAAVRLSRDRIGAELRRSGGARRAARAFHLPPT